MENLSLKNILWVLIATVVGFTLGMIAGTLLGVIIWMLASLVFGNFVYHSPNAMLINILLSVFLGVLLSLPIVPIADKLFGVRMRYFVWAIMGAAFGLLVMFSYGTNILRHPEIYSRYNHIVLMPRGLETDLQQKQELVSNYSEVYYGSGTGQLVGSFLYAAAAFVISFHETIGKKRRIEDKEQFDEYARFLKEKLNK